MNNIEKIVALIKYDFDLKKSIYIKYPDEKIEKLNKIRNIFAWLLFISPIGICSFYLIPDYPLLLLPLTSISFLLSMLFCYYPLVNLIISLNDKIIIKKINHNILLLQEEYNKINNNVEQLLKYPELTTLRAILDSNIWLNNKSISILKKRPLNVNASLKLLDKLIRAQHLNGYNNIPEYQKILTNKNISIEWKLKNINMEFISFNSNLLFLDENVFFQIKYLEYDSDYLLNFFMNLKSRNFSSFEIENILNLLTENDKLIFQSVINTKGIIIEAKKLPFIHREKNVYFLAKN